MNAYSLLAVNPLDGYGGSNDITFTGSAQQTEFTSLLHYPD